MHALSFIVGVVGNVTSILVFASPLSTFWRVVRNGSTEDFEGLPYVCALLNSSMWTYYGVTKADGLLIATVNSVGIILEFIYVGLFIIYAPPPIRIRIAVLVVILDVGFLSGVILTTRLAMHGSLRVTVIGCMCAGLSLFFYSSPLVAMRTVISSKSVEYMPFFLSFFLFVNGAVWTFYSYLEKDFFIGLNNGVYFWQVPNGIGFILGTAQLILYTIYMNTKIAKGRTKDIMAESKEPLIKSAEGHKIHMGKAYDVGSHCNGKPTSTSISY
ncbi:bidirectional sugar transporter SWEET17-like [Magnolia sinica]|uniref:bidirectional sugar transporter SWEET17-like n=1 Tax=Magnolia sinica TaxID=86752 RepID=UPI002657E1C3|nr:bidirectional sugar transporter SWEET17-like [Magnolia sinica]